MAFSGSEVTRHGLYGGPRATYAGFSAKTPATEDSTATHTDHDGAVFRSPVLSVLTADDSWRMADLEGVQAGTRDRIEQRFIRLGEGSTDGDTLRVVAHSLRAGEPFAVTALAVTWQPSGELPDKAAVTTERTDWDGATLAPPVPVVLTSSESGKLGALEGAETLAQGLPRVRSNRSGWGTCTGRSVRIVAHSFRAGRPMGLLGALVRWDTASDGLTRTATT